MDRQLEKLIWKEYRSGSGNQKAVLKEIARRHGLPWQEVRSAVARKGSYRRKCIAAGAAMLALGAAGTWYGAVREPATREESRRLTGEELGRIPGVRTVFAATGSNADAIMIAYPHMMHVGSVYYLSFEEHLESVKKICYSLYDHYGVRSLLVEGLFREHVERYNRTGNPGLAAPADSAEAKRSMQHLENIITSRKWNLLAAETADNMERVREAEKPIAKVHEDFYQTLRQSIGDIVSSYVRPEGYVHSSDMQSLRRQCEEAHHRLRQAAVTRLESLFTKEKIAEMHGLLVDEREEHYAAAIRACRTLGKAPVIVLLAPAHAYTFWDRTGSMGLAFAGIIPEGLEGDLSRRGPEHVVSQYRIPSTLLPIAVSDVLDERGSPLRF